MLRNILIIPLLIAMVFLGSSTAYAESYPLQFNDHIIGGHRILDLERELLLQYGVDAKRLNIDKIDVIVKSMQGGGQLWLGADYSQQDRRTVTGQALNFNNPAPWTFRHIVFPGRRGDENLQLNLYGQFKLREVVVHTGNISRSEDVIKGKQGDIQLRLPMQHLTLSGNNSIDLLQLVENDSALNPRRYYLQRVSVSLKSLNGDAEAWLEDGQELSQRQGVDGSVELFESNDAGTYRTLFFNAGTRQHQLVSWQLRLRGEIKLNEIIVYLAPR